MKHGSLFSGIGGFDLASEWMGWTNVFHCEWNEFGKRVLKYYWPKSIAYNDITKTDFTIHRGQIDILTGGFPCQPYSAAGKRKGKEDDRHLWPEMLRAIREIQPSWVVGENVRGLVNWSGGLVFDEVQADLEAEGYEVLPFLLPAVAKDAPHRRDRIWFVAYSISLRCNNGCYNWQKRHFQNNINGASKKGESKRNRRERRTCEVSKAELQGTFTNTGRKRNKECEKGCNSIKYGFSLNESDTFHGTGAITDTSNEGLQRSEEQRGVKEGRKKRNKQPSRLLQPDWQNFPTESPVCGGDDGLPPELDGITVPKWRNESIKAYGNAVVPQVVYEIFKAIELYERLR